MILKLKIKNTFTLCLFTLLICNAVFAQDEWVLKKEIETKLRKELLKEAGNALEE